MFLFIFLNRFWCDCAQECRNAVLAGKIDGPPIAADGKIAEQSQVSAQDPVSTMLRGAVATFPADFDPARYAARCIIGDGNEANFGIFDSAWEKIEDRERRAARPLYLRAFSARFGTAKRTAQCRFRAGACACIFPDDWICG